MLEYVRKLQEKPKRTRRRIAFGLSLVITLTLGAVWLSVIPQERRGEKREQAHAPSPIETLGGSFKDLFSELSENLAAVGNINRKGATTTNTISTTTPEETGGEDMASSTENSPKPSHIYPADWDEE